MKIIKSLLLLAVLLLVSACGNKLPYKAQEPLENAALVYIYVPFHVSASDSVSATNYMIRINNKQTDERIIEGEYMALNLKPQAMTISATKQEVMEKVLKFDLEAGQIYYLKIVDDMAGGAFEFFEVDSSTGSKEIAKTGLVGTNEESPENIITELVGLDSEDDAVVKNEAKATMTEAEVDAMIERKLSQRTVAQPTAVNGVSTTPSSSSVPLIAPLSDAPKVQTAQPTTTTATKTSVSQMDEIMKAYEMKEKGILSDAEFKAIKANILSK